MMIRRIAALFLFILSWMVPASAHAQDLGAAVLVKDARGSDVAIYRGSYALLVGVSNYTEGWPRLPGVRKDIEEVRRALERHGFLNEVVMNPDRAGMVKAFDDFVNRYGLNPDNRLLFYYAGHGHTVTQSYGEEMGYIVPVDAPNPENNSANFLMKALDLQYIEVLSKRIQSKHALFLFDSCFSGSLFSLSRAVPESISYKTGRPVRQFITSGGADEQVPDVSIFRMQLVAALNGEAELGKDGYLTGSALGEFLQTTVTNYSKGAQHPQYGRIRNPNLDKGDFVFIIKHNAPSETNVTIDINIKTTDTARPQAPRDTPSSSLPERAYAAFDSEYPSLKFQRIRNRFRRESDGTVHDELLKSRWRAFPEEIFNLEDAKNKVAAIGGGWRLPSREELQTLITQNKESDDWGKIDSIFPKNKRTGRYWTSTSGLFGSIWFVDFSNGSLSRESGENYNGLYLILRGGK